MPSYMVVFARFLSLSWLAFASFRTAEAAGWGRVSSISAWRKPSLQRVPDPLEGYVKYDEEKGVFSFTRGLKGSFGDESPAHGSFSDALRHKSNFGQLRISTNPAFPDDVQMQAAGFLEGYLTAERIFDYAYNMKSWLSAQTNDTFKVGDWLFDQDRWARQQVKQNTASPDNSISYSYWRAVGLVISQADGMMAGYSARLAELGPEGPLDRLTKWDFLVLNALGDMDDLLAIIFPDNDDGTNTSDYDNIGSSTGNQDDGAVEATVVVANIRTATATNTSKLRKPNPERDASFFFRREAKDNAEDEGTATEGTAAEGMVKHHKQQQQQQQQPPAEEDEGEEGLALAAPRGPWEELTPGQVRTRIAMHGRCTALVKVTPGLDDLLLGHVTWWTYASMLRIYKHYDIQLRRLTGQYGRPANTRVSFSSYPGQISSADDWYLLGSGLVVTETSLDTFDHNRYNASYGCTISSLLSWHRVLVANLLAADGPGWAELASANNGGTYNNQYMIVNMNLFTPGSELQPGLLTVTEIIPGLAVTTDATKDLLLGHFPSYNVPYFPEVYEAAGYRRHAEALAARGQAFAAVAQEISYQLAARAKIFRRDAASAADLDSFRRLLRSNGWDRRPANSDPLSVSSPWDALCARGDLDPDSPALYGCYDGKVTNYRRALELSSDAINGPTTENGQQPFRWDVHGRVRRTKYRGMLEVYDTEWEEQRP